MQHTTRQLKERLTRALDKENNVVDMLGVLEVISALERTNITRECLEETGIGKHVNEMRKKTSNKDLAKRARNLVKKWQQLVKPQSTPASFNGDKLAKSAVPTHLKTTITPASPASRPDTPLSSNSNSNSPNVQRLSRSGTPHMTYGKHNRISPAAVNKTGNAAFKPISPALQTAVHLNTSVNLGRYSPHDVPRSHNGHRDKPSTPSDDGRLNVDRKRKRNEGTPTGDIIPNKKRAISGNNDSVHASSKPNAVMNGLVKGPHSYSTSHINELSTKQGPDAVAVAVSSFAAKRQAKLNINTDRHQLQRTPSTPSQISDLSSKLSFTPISTKTPTSLTPRVKTTAQLLQEMSSSGSLNIAGSEAVRKIALNQFEIEHDDDSSIVPAGAKPRPRKKPKNCAPPHFNEKQLHETKHEMVHKFLATSVPVPPTPDGDLSDLGLTTARSGNESRNTGIYNNVSNSFIENGSCGANSSNKQDLPVGNEDDTHLALDNPELERRRVAPVRIKLGARRVSSEKDSNVTIAETAEIIPNSTQDPYSLLPEINPDSIQWDSYDYEPPEPLEVTPSVIERLHSEQWTGLNGQYDTWGDWRNWTRPYSASSYNGDLLHILPYVVLEQDDNDDLLNNISSDHHVNDETKDQNGENS